MLDIKAQSRLAEAAASMMRACALATARAAGASALQGMSLWAQMLRPSTAQPPGCGGAVDTSSPDVPAEDAPSAPQAASGTAVGDQAFASYRSSGGHAVAQVVVP